MQTSKTTSLNCSYCSRGESECGPLQKASNADVYICLSCAEKAVQDIKNPPAVKPPLDTNNGTTITVAIIILILGVVAMSVL